MELIFPGKERTAMVAVRNDQPAVPIEMAVKNLKAGRSGRARTCDPRFWRPVLYQLSYTPAGDLRRRRSAPFQAYGKAELQGRTDYSSAAYTRLRSSVRKYSRWPGPWDMKTANS